MTQTSPPPVEIPVTPGQLPLLQDFLRTGDSAAQIAARFGVSRNLVNQQLLRVARAGGYETTSQLLAAVHTRRARLVKHRPNSVLWRGLDGLRLAG